MKIKTRILRLYIKCRHILRPKQQVTEEERYSVNIAKKLINNPSSSLTLAPISGKKFIKNDDQNIFIVIESRNITIINHVYSYSVFIEHDALYASLINLFNQTMENKRIVLEHEIKNNIQHSLKDILDKIEVD
jgi:hypothetical protein